MTEARASRRVLATAAAAGALTLALGVCVAALGRGAWPRPWTSPFLAWDAHHYVSIAREGYRASGPGAEEIVWPPLWPAILRLVALVTADLPLASVLAPNLLFLVAAFWLYRLARLDHPPAVAERAVWLLAAAPTAYFFHLGYSESLYLATALPAFYYARLGRWPEASVCGFLAAATRLNGWLILPALAVEAARRPSSARAVPEAPIAERGARGSFSQGCELARAWPLLLIAFGVMPHLAINESLFGNPLHFLEVQKTFFRKSLSFPWTGLFGAFEGLASQPAHEWILTCLAEAAAGVGLAVFAIHAFRTQRASYAVYAALNALFVTSTGFWCSLPRYALAVFPLFLAAASWARTERRLRLLIGAGVCLQSAGLALFALGSWAF
ncbi:MAG: hypothetical protein HY554_17425 [Elusimicrobia bacterium]|nr:hypothetical protein [Elusimicrobiota bacterium]